MKKVVLAISALMLLASCGANSTSSGSTVNVDTSVITDKTVVMADARNIGQEAPTLGSGDHVVQVWADFQCPACQSAESTITPVLEELADAGKLKVEYRQYPLSFHANANGDAMAAMCAQDQNKYYAYKKALYVLELQRGGAAVNTADHIKIAEDLGLDSATFSSCVNDGKYKDYVAKSVQLGTSLGVTGTPTYILDGKQLSMGAFGTVDQFKSFLDQVVAMPVQQ